MELNCIFCCSRPKLCVIKCTLLYQVQTADSGKYVCTISDGFNIVIQSEATLDVKGTACV